jgi:peptide deformylase
VAILKVAQLGHPVLREPSLPVPPEQIRTPDFRRFIDDMIETMHAYDGVGLAAPQVHVPWRVATIEVSGNPRYPEAPAVPLTVLVNPEIRAAGEEKEVDWEGCLSVPDLRGKVPRVRVIEVRGLDREGRLIVFRAEGFAARVVQHEVDHLDGKVYLDRMDDLLTLTHLQEFARYWARK